MPKHQSVIPLKGVHFGLSEKGKHRQQLETRCIGPILVLVQEISVLTDVSFSGPDDGTETGQMCGLSLNSTGQIKLVQGTGTGSVPVFFGKSCETTSQ